MNSFLFSVILATVLIPLTSYSQTLREFSNTSGKVIRASIVSATDEEVTLKLENGNVITGGVAFFSKKDQEYIKSWAKKNPTPIRYEFTIQTTKGRTNRDKNTRGTIHVTYEDWVYKIQIENRSKKGNSGTSIKGLQLQYNVVLSPQVRSQRSSGSQKPLQLSGRYHIKKGNLSVPAMDYLAKQEMVDSIKELLLV